MWSFDRVSTVLIEKVSKIFGVNKFNEIKSKRNASYLGLIANFVIYVCLFLYSGRAINFISADLYNIMRFASMITLLPLLLLIFIFPNKVPRFVYYLYIVLLSILFSGLIEEIVLFDTFGIFIFLIIFHILINLFLYYIEFLDKDDMTKSILTIFLTFLFIQLGFYIYLSYNTSFNELLLAIIQSSSAESSLDPFIGFILFIILYFVANITIIQMILLSIDDKIDNKSDSKIELYFSFLLLHAIALILVLFVSMWITSDDD